MWGYGSPFWYTRHFCGDKKLSQKSLKNRLHLAAEQEVFGVHCYKCSKEQGLLTPLMPQFILWTLNNHLKLKEQKQDICHLSFLWVYGWEVGKYLMPRFPGWNGHIYIHICTCGCLHIHRGKCISSSTVHRENACRHWYEQLPLIDYEGQYKCHL